MQLEEDPILFELIEDSLKQIEFNTILDYISSFAVTTYGKNRILDARPANNFDKLRFEFDLIEETIFVINKYDSIPLENLGEIKSILHKCQIENAVLNPSEILGVNGLLQISRKIKSFFKQKEDEASKLANLASSLWENRLLEKHINDCLDETGQIRDTASRELQRLRNEIIEKSARLRKRLQKILKNVADEDFLQDDFITIREGRFVIPIKIEDKRKVTGIIHGVSQTGATVFIEPAEIIEMNNELSLLENEERREIHRILRHLTQEIANGASNLLNSLEILTHLDSLIAKAKFAIKFEGLKPELTNQNEIILENIRHPLLAIKYGNKNVVPLSINFHNRKRGHLISGPNAGGKTVALKSIGINIALVLSGFFPNGFCRTPYVLIFTSIGDLQSIEQNLSTFSSQVLRLKKILEYSSFNSLVLIDEIGSGTDPHEGSALAASILESLVNLNCFFVATTHNSFLKTYALSKPVIENDSMEFDEKLLKPTYHFLQGIPGNSYALELAQLLGLPSLIIERARSFLGSNQSNIENSIKELYQVKIQTEKIKTELEAEKFRFEEMNRKLEEQLQTLNSKRKELLDNAKIEAFEIIRNANSLIEKTIKEIQEKEKSFAQIKKEFNAEKNKITKQANEVFKLLEKNFTFQHHFSAGELVYIDSPNNIGVIIQIIPEQKTAIVDFNGIKFKIPLEKLKLVDKDKLVQNQLFRYPLSFATKTTLDIRGLRVNEALSQIDKFLSDAVLGNIDYLTIIHGKGTGALRKALHDFLQNYPQIESFREGTIEEGGAGVTIVKLK
ncbi:MAG: endonuclease MutS2 [Candidatus Kapaibacteriales bacterium]